MTHKTRSAGWHPQPLTEERKLSFIDEGPIVVKALNPMQKQRALDGTPVTRGNITVFKPEETTLYLKPELQKGSLVENVGGRKITPDVDPPLLNCSAVIKAFLAARPAEQVAKSQETSKAAATMAEAILDFVNRVGLSTKP
jgi:hypothetical protein